MGGGVETCLLPFFWEVEEIDSFDNGCASDISGCMQVPFFFLFFLPTAKAFFDHLTTV